MADTLRENAVIENPLTMFPWVAAYWAEDPAQTWPADGVEVSPWRNAGTASGIDLYAYNTAPTYKASGINGKPSVAFSRTPSWQALQSLGIPSRIDPPVAVVAIIQPTSPDTGLGTQGIAHCAWYNGGNNYLRTTGNGILTWSGWSTTITASPVPYQNQTLVVAQTRPSGVYDLRAYGTTNTATVVNAGGSGWGGYSNLFLGSSPAYTQSMEGYISFYGVYAGDITTHGSYTPFIIWAQTYYGLRSVT